jgi:hypothetical protein
MTKRTRGHDHYIKFNVDDIRNAEEYYRFIVEHLTKQAKEKGCVLKVLTIKEAEALGLPTEGQIELKPQT